MERQTLKESTDELLIFNSLEISFEKPNVERKEQAIKEIKLNAQNQSF